MWRDSEVIIEAKTWDPGRPEEERSRFLFQSYIDHRKAIGVT